jgi:tRNA A37 threonylcarbamoyladenosine biosynthesis protein TsaE
MMLLDTPESMFELGKSLALQNKKVLLIGELGAGKTTFSK